MNATYAPFIDPASGKPLSPQGHGHTLATLLIILALALVIGAWYWVGQMSVQSVSQPSFVAKNPRTEMSALLANAPVHPSQKAVDGVASLLSQKPATKVTAADQARMASQLQEY